MRQISRVVLIYPEYRIGPLDKYAPRMNGKSAVSPPLGLLTVAACLPKEWEVKILDCSVQPFDPKSIDWADLVMVGGSYVQRESAVHLLRVAKSKGKITVAGGIDTFASIEWYDEFDHILRGEAELTIPRFIEDLKTGNAKHEYDCRSERADMRLSPVPRFDLIDLKAYIHPAIQCVRGCPYQCEFCSVPAQLGRVPRYKSTTQIREELSLLFRLGYRGRIKLNDDNFIGNVELCKQITCDLISFQREFGYPFQFSCLATMNLCDSPILLDLFRDAGIDRVFFGVEATEAEVLKGHGKLQNIRFVKPQSIHALFSRGIRICASVIFGEDSETDLHGKNVFQFLQKAGIPNLVVNFLDAMPNTRLNDRLKRENRLLFDSSSALNTPENHQEVLNFKTVRPRRAVVGDYLWFVRNTHHARQFFMRIRTMLEHFCPQLRCPTLGENPTLFAVVLLKLDKWSWFAYGVIRFPSFGIHFMVEFFYWLSKDRTKLPILFECSYECLLAQFRIQAYETIATHCMSGSEPAT